MSLLYKSVSKITNFLKPVLLKLVPYEWLRKAKGRMISHSYDQIQKIDREPFDRSRYADGINLIGDIKSVSGLGKSCRLVADVLKYSGYDMDIYPYDTFGVVDGEMLPEWKEYITSEPKYNINLVHINPHELGIAYLQADRQVWNCRYNIAYWLWELEEFPDEWVPCFQCVDEIWAPSEFICKALRKKTNLPVHCIPYHLEIDLKKEYKRDDFDLPEDRFLFLMMYDSNSCQERKNPLGVIRAFQQAFDRTEQGVGLVIKVNHCKDSDIEAIHKALDGYDNVYLLKENLSEEQVYGLIQTVDVVVSLHRAEGFGLVLAEAMLLGTPTIATNWSSNTEFMNSDVACMVDYELVTLQKDMPPFKAGNRWADPDVQQAAGYMRKLRDDEKFYQQIAENAKISISNQLGREQIEKRIQKRIHDIYESQKDD